MSFPSRVLQVTVRIGNQVSLNKYSVDSVFQLRSFMSKFSILKCDQPEDRSGTGKPRGRRLPFISFTQRRDMGGMMFTMPGIVTQQVPEGDLLFRFRVIDRSLPILHIKVADRGVPSGMQGI